MPYSLPQRLAVTAAFVAAALAVALLAAGSHVAQGERLTNAALLLILEAPMLLALVAGYRSGLFSGWIIAWAGFASLTGTALFTADMANRVFLGVPLFGNAAPLGGSLVIGAWTVAAVASLLRRG